MQRLAGSAVGRVKCSIVAIGTATASDLAVTVGTGKSGIEDNLLETLAVFPLEIADERIVSFPVREAVFFESF